MSWLRILVLKLPRIRDCKKLKSKKKENEAVDPFVLGPETVYYSAHDVQELQQEWQEVHQQELFDVQQ